LRLIQALKKATKRLRPVGDRSVELVFSFVCNKSDTPGWVAGWRTQAEGRAEIADIAVVAVMGRSKPTMDAGPENLDIE